jgi:hypothetical protein
MASKVANKVGDKAGGRGFAEPLRRVKSEKGV